MDRTMILQERVKEIASTSQKIRDFLTSVLDEKSFVETNAFLFSTQETYMENPAKGEGVVTGYGTIGSMPVYVYAQNQEVLGGGLGKAQASKIVKILELAEKTATPVLAIIDSNGARLGEGVEALSGYGKIMKKVASLQGVVPQIAVIKGKAVGQMAYIAGMQDFTFMVEGSVCATQSPEVVIAKSCDSSKTAGALGAKYHAETTGLCCGVVAENEVGAELERLLDCVLCSGEADFSAIAGNPAVASAKTTREILEAIADTASIYEVSKEYATGLFTSFAKIGGVVCGFVGTDNAYLTSKMAKKAEKFVMFCENNYIPVVSLVDCLGTKACMCVEKHGVSAIANLISTIAITDTLKIAIICKNAVGVGYTAFASKEVGYDYTIALADSFVSALPAQTGAEIVYGEEIKGAKDPAKAREAIEKKYQEIDGDPFNSAKDGDIDNIIDATFLRAYLMQALATLNV